MTGSGGARDGPERPHDGRPVTGVGARRRPGSLTLHVLVEGEKVRRGARAVLAPGRLALGDRVLPFDTVFWVARRAGLLLLFADDFTAAVKGEGSALDEVARAVERGSEHGARRRRLLRPLAHEVVVCTAGTAATGEVGGRPVRGFHVAVFTQEALHLLSRDRHHVLAWPVERARRTRARAGRGDEVLHLSKGTGEVSLRYLFPEEIRAVLRVADRQPRRRSDEGSLEMFARGQVAPPVPARLPEFTVSVDGLHRAAARAARDVAPELAARASLPTHFFELHFQELGEIALGPLLMRKSAASAAPGLSRALEVMDASGLRADTRAAVWSAVDRLLEVYGSELETRLGRKGLAVRQLRDGTIGEEERQRVAEEMWRPVDGLAPHLEALERCQAALREGLDALESGPPEGEREEEKVRSAAAEWRTALQRLDRAYAAAWRDLLAVIAETWSGKLLPRLARAEAIGSSPLPVRVRWGIAALGLLLLVVLAALLLGG